MDFYDILGDFIKNPFAARTEDGEWIEGTISIPFLNANFSQYETAEEMINATDAEGLKLYFAWLRDEKGLLD
jgi:hypothetical protein